MTIKTSTLIFCDIHVEQILEHSVKENILNEILNLTGLRFQDAYSKKVNQSLSGQLRQPHLLTLATRGKPYWLYCTHVNGVECCVLIEKFIKIGYPYPKMVVAKFVFDSAVYSNTLFECEMNRVNGREKEWVLLVQDLLSFQNRNMRLVEPIARYNQLHAIFENMFTEDMILQPCALQLKKPFCSKEMYDLKRLCKEVPYQVTGILFVPYNTENEVLCWDDTGHMLQQHQQKRMGGNRHPSSNPHYPVSSTNNQRKPFRQTPLQSQPPQHSFTPINLEISELNLDDIPVYSSQIEMYSRSDEIAPVTTKPTGKEFTIKKSARPGIYQIADELDDGISDTLHIPNLETSKRMKTIFASSDRVLLRCIFNENFCKWEPISV